MSNLGGSGGMGSAQKFSTGTFCVVLTIEEDDINVFLLGLLICITH